MACYISTVRTLALVSMPLWLASLTACNGPTCEGHISGIDVPACRDDRGWAEVRCVPDGVECSTNPERTAVLCELGDGTLVTGTRPVCDDDGNIVCPPLEVSSDRILETHPECSGIRF
jgi:hypothetical protein